MKWEFNQGWEFLRGNPAHNADVVEEGWRQVVLPHDWSIEDIPGLGRPFDACLSDGGPACGYAVGGYGWYRRKVAIEEDGDYQFEFDGVMGQADFYLDGAHQLFHPYGYTPILLHARLAAGDHTLSVRVRSLGSHSRWYSGSGIIRQAWMKRLGSGLRLTPWGLWGRTLQADSRSALLRIDAELEKGGQAVLSLLDPEGNPVWQEASLLHVGVNTRLVSVENPRLWTLWDLAEGPQPLYTLRLEAEGAHEEAVLGIRSVVLDPEAGLSVNGQKALLKGGCLHHDMGILGAAAHPGAEERRVALLKEAGFNAVRTSHNPPSRAFLEACDRAGMAVMDEAFDEWVSPKTPDSYARWFEEWSDRDLAAMVRRDRSRPCVWFYSIGNEIIDSYSRPDIAARLRSTVLSCDDSRPVTAGICAPWWSQKDWQGWGPGADSAFSSLDCAGVNYLWKEAEEDMPRVPDRVILHTESFALDAWEDWRQALELPQVIGDFVWTAMDYIGESGIGQAWLSPGEPKNGAYPFHLAVCGDLDLLGARKPWSYWRQALWQPGILHAAVLPDPSGHGVTENDAWHSKWGFRPVESHWNWEGQEDREVTVEVYSSFERVEVFLNGAKVGEAPTGWAEKRMASFRIPYQPGILTVRGFGPGEGEFTLRTAGEAVDLRAWAEPVRQGIAWVWTAAVDAGGAVCPRCAKEVKAAVRGGVELLAFGNASPMDVTSVQDPVHCLHRGLAAAVLRVDGPGQIGFSSNDAQVVVEVGP